jgi:hypothetical protein
LLDILRNGGGFIAGLSQRSSEERPPLPELRQLRQILDQLL